MISQHAHIHVYAHITPSSLTLSVIRSSAFCVSQSIKILPSTSPNLAHHLIELSKTDQTTHPSLKSTVSLRSFGSSSLNWDSILSFEGDVLAKAVRTWVRVCGVTLKPLEFSSGEKEVLESLIDPLEGLDDLINRVNSMPRVIEHETDIKSRARLRINGQHTNFGNHVDHAQLLEMSLLGCEAKNERPTFAKINYMMPGNIGDDVEVVGSGNGEGRVVDVRREGAVLCRTVFSDFKEFNYSLLTDTPVSEDDNNGSVSSRLMLKLKNADVETLKHEETKSSEESAKVRQKLGWINCSSKLGLKSMLLNLGKGRGYVLAVLEGDKKIDLKKLRRILENGKIKFASEGDVNEVTGGCEIGGVPPFGSLFNGEVKTLVDEGVLKNEFCYFNAADKTVSVKMRVKEWVEAEKPEAHDFAQAQV